MPKIKKDEFTWYVPEGEEKYLPLMDWEDYMISQIKDHFPNGIQLIDIGANVGLYSIKLAGNFKSVVAIEPSPVNIYILKKNIELNNLNNVTVLETAIWKRVELLFLNQLDAKGHASDSVERSVNPSAVSKPLPILGVPLDDYNLNPDFIKMDIEGGEFEAIYGMVETIQRCKPTLLVEIHQFKNMGTIEDFHKIMRGLGYNCTAVLGNWYEYGVSLIQNCVYEPA
jgi:FkbM family methyltransferase